MKKYLLISLTVLFAAAFVWAEEATTVEPKIDIDANATVTWGVDFGKGTQKLADRAKHGFKNDLSWKVKFPLIKKGDKTSANSDVPVYAEVTLKDIELNILSKHDKNDKKFALDGKVDKMEAKLVFYGAYITVYDKPSFKTNYANLWEPLKKSDDYDDKEDEVTYKFEPGCDGYGTKIGYANKDLMGLDVGLKFGSNGNWKANTDPNGIDYKNASAPTLQNKAKDTKITADEAWYNVDTRKTYYKDDKVPAGTYLVYDKTKNGKGWHSKYGIGLDFAMTPLDKLLGIKLNVNSTFEKVGKYKFGTADEQDGDSLALNIGAEVTSEPIDALMLKLGFDGGSSFNTNNINKGKPIYAFAWDMLFDAQYKWVGAGMYIASAGTPYFGVAGNTTDAAKKYTPDMAFYAKFETKSDKKEASHLVEGLDAGVHLGFYRLLTFANKDKDNKTQLPMLMKLFGSYKAALNDSMWVKPFATVWAETNHTKTEDGTTLKKPYIGFMYELGVTYSPAEKVEVTAKWAHGKLDENKYGGGSDGLLIKAPANYKNHNGTFTVALKVKY